MKYVGARYMPKFIGTYDATQVYEALSVVDNGLGTSYVSNIPVPAGTPLTDTTYWSVYGSTSGAIINLQNQIDNINDNIDKIVALIDVTKIESGNDITSAINTIFASGRNPYLPAGSYIISNVIYIPDGYGIYGTPGTQITNTASGTMISMGNNTFLKGFEIIDSTTSGTDALISIPNKENVTIENLKITNAYYIGIGVHLSSNINIKGCQISTQKHDGIARYKGNSSFVRGACLNIIDNVLDHIGLDGISFGGTCNICYNRISNCGEEQSAAGIYGAEVSETTIKGNVINTTTGNGIDIAGGTGQNIHNEVVMNRVSETDGVGILLNRSLRSIIKRNYLYKTGKVGNVNGGAAISILGNSYYIDIEYNYINNNPNSAFYLASTAVNCIIDTNDIEGGTVNTTYASDGNPNYYTIDKTPNAI